VILQNLENRTDNDSIQFDDPTAQVDFSDGEG
jgi:hypothetical protein